MQFDLAHPPKFPVLPELNSGSKLPKHWLRIGLYAVAAVIVLWLLLWSRAQSKKLNSQIIHDREMYTRETAVTLSTAISQSSLSAIELATRGMALVAKNPFVASLVLEAASAKDPQYRDAAVGAGFAELAVAEPLWSVNGQEAKAHTETARRYLEAAQAIDPIHAKTYELLAVTYGNLGQADLAAEATKKATAFAIQS